MKRLFEHLVVSGNRAARSPSIRTLPFSLALHATAVAALAMLSLGVGRDQPPGPAGPLVFHSAPAPKGTGLVRAAPSPPRRSRRGGTRPLVVDARPAIVSDVHASDTAPDVLDMPVADVPICLSGCTPGGSGGGDTGAGADGPGGTGADPGPPLRIGGEIREPRRIGGTPPLYPELARRARVQGKVVLECVIDTDGRVTDLRVVSGNPLLAEAATEAVRRWVYSPTTLNGQPVRVILTVTVKFGLAES